MSQEVRPVHEVAPGVTAPWWMRHLRIAPGEGGLVLRSMLCAAAVFASYAVLRPVRETMGLSAGVANLPWLFWGTFVLMVVVQPIYGWLLRRERIADSVPLVFVCFGLMVLGFYAGFMAVGDDAWLARAYFLWLSVFNLFVVAVFWSLMADLWRAEHAARLFGMIAAGISLGGIVGALMAAVLAELIGTISLLLPSAALLGAAAFLARGLVGRLPPERGQTSRHVPPPAVDWSAFTQVAGSSYLRSIAVFILGMTTVSTCLYLMQQHMVAAAIPERDARTALFAWLDLGVQVGALLVQLLVFQRVVARCGHRMTLMAIPALMVVACLGIACLPLLPVVLAAMTVRRIGDYGLTRPSRDMLFTVIPQAWKYRSKVLLDTLVYRAGDAVAASGFAFVMACFPTGSWWPALVAAGLALCWLGNSWRLGSHFRRLSAGTPSEGEAQDSRNTSSSGTRPDGARPQDRQPAPR
jgi:ATP:ADP antiporter, AAA family